MLRYAAQKPPGNIAKHYTPVALANHLVGLVPIGKNDCVLDPSAGRTRVFYKAFPTRRKLYCEVTEGSDFLARPLVYDWAITNPPYHLLWKFIDKTSQEGLKGFGFLVNINGINTLTPKRLELLRGRGFHLRLLHTCNVKQWFGRYYFYVFQRQKGECFLSWDTKSWV